MNEVFESVLSVLGALTLITLSSLWYADRMDRRRIEWRKPRQLLPPSLPIGQINPPPLPLPLALPEVPSPADIMAMDSILQRKAEQLARAVDDAPHLSMTKVTLYRELQDTENELAKLRGKDRRR